MHCQEPASVSLDNMVTWLLSRITEQQYLTQRYALICQQARSSRNRHHIMYMDMTEDVAKMLGSPA